MAKIQPPKGTRDFYPEEMRRRRHLEDVWRRVSLRAGFEEVDGPIFESLELYIQKSGVEIVDQLYNFKDKGEREVAIRPEFTPTLARMVAARQAALPRPIKWFNISRVCRYERAQKGRLREFFQWNCDILGAPGMAADAECIAVAVDALRELGLTSDQVEVRLSSRKLLAAALKSIGLADEKLPGIYLTLDKRGKVPEEVVRGMLDGMGLPPDQRGGVDRLFAATTVNELLELGGEAKQAVASSNVSGQPSCVEQAYDEMCELFRLVEAYGAKDFLHFDIRIVRGLAYYTGPVWEVFDKRGELRSLFGGGRYDNLIATMGGQPMPACGFGAGDVTTGLLMDSLNLWPSDRGRKQAVVAYTEERFLVEAVHLVGELRRHGISAQYMLNPASLSRQMKFAAETGASYVAIVSGEIVRPGSIRIRDMASGEESDGSVEKLTRLTQL